MPTSESMYTPKPAPTYKVKCVCFVLKACADKRKYVYPRACADIQRKVCMLRSKSLCRQAKVCIPQSLSAPTYKGKCVCFVLKACADKRKYVYPRACADIQRKVCMPRSKSLCQRTNRGSVYNTLSKLSECKVTINVSYFIIPYFGKVIL